MSSTDWASYSHQELWDMLAQANPEELHARAVTVQNLAHDMHNVALDTQGHGARALSSWSGPTAQKATTSFNHVTKWADTTADRTSKIAHGLGEYADAVDRARQKMPEPVPLTDDEHAAMMGDPGAMERIQQGPNAAKSMDKIEQARTLKTEAVSVMEQYHADSHSIAKELPTYEKPPVVNPNGSGVVDPVPSPTIPPPPSEPTIPPPTDQPPVGTAPPVTTAPGSPGGPGGPGGPGQSTAPSWADPGTGEPGVIGAGGGLPGEGVPGLGGVNGAGPALGPLGDLAAGGGFGGLGGGGAVSGAGAPGAVAGTAARSSVLGAGAQSGAAAEEEAAASRAAGLAAEEEGGWGGFGPMMPPMGGAPGQQDGQHRNKYGQKPDVIGDLPPAYPPVLGL